MPSLLAKTEKAKGKFHSPLRQFRTVHQATWYDVGDEIILILEWQRNCVSLPERLTKENAAQFIAIAKFAIREFWWIDKEHYDQVKKKAASLVRYKTEGEYIDRALGKIEQAMRSLAHK